MTTPTTPPTGPAWRLPRLLLVARLALAAVTVALGVFLVIATTTSTTSPAPTTVDRIVSGIATLLLVAAGALLLLAQVIAALQAVTAIRAVADPVAVPALLGTRPRRPAVLAALAVCGVIVISAVLPPDASPAATAGLFGLGLVSLVLDTVGAAGTYRYSTRTSFASPPLPDTIRRIQSELMQSVTISRVFGSLLLLAVAITLFEQVISGLPRPATVALQIGAAALAALVAFVLAAVLRRISRCMSGDRVDVTALHRSATTLWLTVGAAVVVTMVAYLAVLGTDYAADKLPTYQALATVFVLLLAVLNSTSLGQLQRGGTPGRAASRMSSRRRM